ncbi:MAG: dual OB domain-containing protein [bacterium]
MELVILTRSSKFGGYCVVGMAQDTGALVRLVTDDADTRGALCREDLAMDNGREAEPLDVVRVAVGAACPGNIQRENVRLERGQPMQYLGTTTLDELLTRHPQPVRNSVFRGSGLSMRPADARTLDHSIEVLSVRDLVLTSVRVDGRNKTRASFDLNGQRQEGFAVTDPKYYLADGQRRTIGDAHIVCSIAEDGAARSIGYYKFVAGIFPTRLPRGTVNRRRVIEHAKGYMDQLAQGIDPINQTSMDSSTRLKKCFAFVSEILEELLAHDGFVMLNDENGAPQYELVRKKTPFQLPPDRRRQIYLPAEPVTPSAFVNQINRQIDAAAMEKLSVTQINAWLLKRRYVTGSKRFAMIRRTVLEPTPKGQALGITADKAVDPETGEIKPRVVLTRNAQRFLLDNLDRILSENGDEEESYSNHQN